MALTGSPFPWELWLEICRMAESEYADVDAKHARGIASGLSALSRSCRTFYNILQPSIYGSPVLVGVRSLELYFRTVVQNDNLASMARKVRWYEGDRTEVKQLILEEFSSRINGVQDDPFEFGDNFHARYSAKVRALGIRLNDLHDNTRGTDKIMHRYPQILPFFLPNLKALDYQHSRLEGFHLLDIYPYHSQEVLPLTDISIRAVREDSLKLNTLVPLFSRSRDTLESLHLQWPLAINDYGEWPESPLFTQLKKLSVHDGCLGLDSFTELLSHAPRLEELTYHSARVSHDDCFDKETPGAEEEEFLTWNAIVNALLQVRKTLQRLELDLHRRYFKAFSSFRLGLTAFMRLQTVVLGQDAILDDVAVALSRNRLDIILPRNLKHLEFRQIRCTYQQIQAFAQVVRDGEYPTLETVEMDIRCLHPTGIAHESSLEEIKAMLESTGVRTEITTPEEE